MKYHTLGLLDDTVCELGEGPSDDPHRDVLYRFDIAGKRLIERGIDSGKRHIHDLPSTSSAVSRTDGDRQLIATETGLVVRNRENGGMELLQPIEADNGMTRSNDSRVHPSGAFWVGTMGKKAERHAGAIYWYRLGELRTLYSKIAIPNSICFSPDGAVAYFADTGNGVLFKVDCDPRNGLATGDPAVFVDRRGKPAPTSAWRNMSAGERAAGPRAGETFMLSRTVRGRTEPDVSA